MFLKYVSICTVGEIARLFPVNLGSLQLLITSIRFSPSSKDLTTQLLPSAHSQPQILLPHSLSLPPKRCNLYPLWIHRLELQRVQCFIALDVICAIRQPTEQAFTAL